MSDPISAIKGITDEVKTQLEAQGVRTADQFLEKAHTNAQRTELAKQLSISARDLKELVNRADLMRLKGVGGDLANLLEEAGVNSNRELSHRTAEALYAKLVEVQGQKKIAHHLPTQAQVTSWVAEAKTLAASSPE